MTYKLTSDRVHALANGSILACTAYLVYYAWVGEPSSKLIVKFAVDTAPSWLSFLTALLAAMLVFIGFVYTVQDEIFWRLLSTRVNLEQKAYKAVLLVGAACIFLILSSQPNPTPTYSGWQGALAILGFMAGSQGLIKVYFVFVHFYDLNYAERRKLLLRKRSSDVQRLRERHLARRLVRQVRARR